MENTALSNFYAANAAGIGGLCVNSNCFKLVKSHTDIISNTNITLSDKEAMYEPMYEHMVDNLTALLHYVGDLSRGSKLLDELITEPESFIPYNVMLYILDEWEQLKSLSYTYRFLFDIAAIWSDITFEQSDIDNLIS